MNVRIKNEEIQLKGDAVMIDYYDNPEENAAAFDEGGGLRPETLAISITKDICYITGRAKNLIILDNGKNIYPEEIEGYLMKISGVKDAFVYEDSGKISALIVPESMRDTTIRVIKNGIREMNDKLPVFKGKQCGYQG